MRRLLLCGALPAVVLATATLARAAQQLPPPWKPEPRRADAGRVLVVTGGHDHDPDFYAVFDDAAFRTTVDPHPNAFQRDMRERADVLVMYDMLAQLEPARQANLRAFVEAGRGVVVLHHAICTGKDPTRRLPFPTSTTRTSWSGPPSITRSPAGCLRSASGTRPTRASRSRPGSRCS